LITNADAEYELFSTILDPASASSPNTWIEAGLSSHRQVAKSRRAQRVRTSVSRYVNGHAAWAVGMEKIELLRKDGKGVRWTFSQLQVSGYRHYTGSK
jgi:hypothetical protein